MPGTGRRPGTGISPSCATLPHRYDTTTALRTIRKVSDQTNPVDGATPPSRTLDARGIPTHECPTCRSAVFNVRAVFVDYDIAAWFTDATCAECGTLVTAPCPPDMPDGYTPAADIDSDR